MRGEEHTSASPGGDDGHNHCEHAGTFPRQINWPFAIREWRGLLELLTRHRSLTVLWVGLAGLVLLAANGCQISSSTSKAPTPAKHGSISSLNNQLVPAGPRVGIVVHGWWTIEVRNPDGSLVTHRELENSLAGPYALDQLLTRQNALNGWEVWANHNGGPWACGGACIIAEPQTDRPTADSKNLTVNVPATGPNAGAIVLQGSVIAVNAATINDVRTYLELCAWADRAGCGGTSPPSVGSGQVELTAAPVSPEVPVSPGQQLLVTVVISFT
jgi:hypothetical protein